MEIFNYLSDRLEKVSPRYKELNKKMENVSTLKKVTSVLVGGVLTACAVNSAVSPTIDSDPSTNPNNTSEFTPTPEQGMYRTEFSWKSDKIAETAKNAGVPESDVRGHVVTIDGAATADGKLKIDFNQFVSQEGDTRSIFYSPEFPKGVNETFAEIKKIDGIDYVYNNYYKSDGTIATISRYRKDASEQLAKGNDVKMTVYPTDFQQTMLPAYNGNGIEVTVTPNPEWKLQSEYYKVAFVGDISVILPSDTDTPTPESNLDSAEHIEAQYKTTLSAEQIVIYENSIDLTTEGKARRFLDNDLSLYLAYVDVDKKSEDFNEVVFVWNSEQQKPNPALLIENNLFINENSASKIIWNPDINRIEAKQTMSDYMKYVRLKLVAEANGIELSNTLEGALANEKAQKKLIEGCNITLNRTSLFGTDHDFNVPDQTLFISDESRIVIKFTNKSDIHMFKMAKGGGVVGISFDQNDDQIIQIQYLSTGTENLSQSKYKDMILSRRLSFIFSHMFARSERPLADAITDQITIQTIFNGESLSTQPILIYSK